jgi:fucose 4-O-acetylase-like acetyltransferase
METRARLAYLDRLKVGLIAGIIAGHAFNSYSEFGSWAYQPVREVSLSSAAEAFFAVVVSIGSLFLMGLFFLISGLLTPPVADACGRKPCVA